MTACVNCSRALQPAWKYCIFCGTRTAVAVAPPATRSRPIPKRTPVPGILTTATAQTPVIETAAEPAPIVPPPAPAPLSAAPTEAPISSEWPATLGERPSLRAALVGTEVPAPTPPREEAPPPVDEGEPEPEFEAEPAFEAEAEPEEEFGPEPEPEAEDEPEPEPTPEPEPEPRPNLDLAPEPEPAPRARPRASRRASAPAGTLLAEPETELTVDDELVLDDEPRDRAGSVNTLAVLALLIGVLACPLAALFGHLALGQVRASGERGVIPAWIAIVLGYLWLGFWIVFAITYFATNG